jgi:prophage DNA circulation protein
MAADRQIILNWISDLSASIVVDEEDLADITTRVVIAAKLTAEDFAPEVLDLMRVVAENASAPAHFDQLALLPVVTGNTLSVCSIMQALALSIAGGRITWPSRPEARRIRSRVSEAGDAGLSAASSLGGDGADLYAWLSSIVAISVRVISDIAANAAPIVNVRTGISLPSTVLAYQLYGDAKRAQGMVDIAGAATSLVMPTTFDALAS